MHEFHIALILTNAWKLLNTCKDIFKKIPIDPFYFDHAMGFNINKKLESECSTLIKRIQENKVA